MDELATLISDINGEGGDNPDNSGSLSIYIAYSLLVLIYQPIFIYGMRNSIRKIIREFRDPVLDIFKLGQYLFFMGFLVTRQLFFFLQYFQLFEFFFDPSSFIVLFFLNGFEVVNLVCWL